MHDTFASRLACGTSANVLRKYLQFTLGRLRIMGGGKNDETNPIRPYWLFLLFPVLPLACAVALNARGLASCELLSNPWKEPPVNVVRQGLPAVVRYWQDANSYGRTFSDRLKVVLVGLSGAGKTSLAIRLEGHDGDRLPGVEERTVGVEIRGIQLGPSPRPWDSSGNDLAVKLWDFAGQRAYYDTHQMFLTQDALYILVVDMFAYRDEHSQEEALQQWLDILQSRIPGAVVLLVGTHEDTLVNSGLYDERIEKIQVDIREAREKRSLRIVNDFFVLDCKSSDIRKIKDLRSMIEAVTYNSDFSFPSVESKIPTPYVYAFLTLDAVRRGADLYSISGGMAMVHDRIGGGDPDKAQAFVRFSVALGRFIDLWEALENITVSPEEAEEVFLSAIRLNEAQGAILLTNVDGRAGGGQDNRVDRSQLIIHVDPVRFADLVRRIVDVRLVEPGDVKKKVETALKKFCSDSGAPLYKLSRQQLRFNDAGEVSKLYLKFLWLHRDLDLGQASKESPPLKMTGADVDAMVGSLVDLRMMFPVRDAAGGFVPDRYVVGTCLPDYIGCEVTPETMLKLDVGSVLCRQVLEVCGARNMPPGLVTRLLAWCGRGEARITACWRQGCCFTFKEHLVLVYECRVSDEQSFIVCCVKGGTNSEKAGDILENVAEEVDCLIRDPRYGFPGIELCATPQDKETVTRDVQLEPVLCKLYDALEDHMNIKIDDLVKKAERMAGGINERLHQGLATLDAIHSKIDFAAAVAGKCLLLAAKESSPCPRLIWIEKDTASSMPSLDVRRFEHFCRKVWYGMRRKKGQTSSNSFRVRFLCAYDLTAAKCGSDGKGYVLKLTDRQRLLQKCLPVIQLSLWLLRVAVSVVARADLLPVDDMLRKLREVGGEEVAARIEALDLANTIGSEKELGPNVEKQVEVFGKAYEELVKLVEEEEEKIAVTTRTVGGSAAGDKPSAGTAPIAGGLGHQAAQTPSSRTVPAGMRSFETDMVLAHRGVVGAGDVECAWVRRSNESAWKASVASKVVGPAPP